MCHACHTLLLTGSVPISGGYHVDFTEKGMRFKEIELLELATVEVPRLECQSSDSKSHVPPLEPLPMMPKMKNQL